MKNPEPYIKILKELGYNLDTIDTIGKKYYLSFGYEKSYLELELQIKDESIEIDIENLNFSIFDFTRLEAYNLDDPENSILFFYTDSKEPSLYDISRLTPDMLKTIAIIKTNIENENLHAHKIIKRYIDCYENVICPIINPVAEYKKLNSCSSIQRWSNLIEFENHNENIEITYFSTEEVKFIIGIEYLTGTLYFHPKKDRDIIWDFENKIITKGRFIELLKKYNI